MAFWTYILRCSDGLYYTGHTDNPDRRIAQHQTRGYCDFTSRRLPVTLVWSEYFSTRLEALEAERIIGRWSRGKKEALIRGDWSMVSHLARPPKERFSTSLETNGNGERGALKTPSTSNQVKMRASASLEFGVGNESAPKNPFVSSEVEKRAAKGSV